MQLPISLILLCSALLFLIVYIITYWTSYVGIKARKQSPLDTAKEPQQWPSISVVIVTHDSNLLLERAIKNIVTQDYPNFEIVVVNNASTDNTNDVIKRYSKLYPNLLRSTYLPQNKMGYLHMAMAVTLGVRAARNEWIMLLKPTSIPKTSLWLRSVALEINAGSTLCIGYNHYYGYDSSLWMRKAIRSRRKSQLLNFRAIYRGKRKPIEAEGSNLAFRKQDFINNRGYARWLYLKNYHENLYVAQYAHKGRTSFLTHPDAQVETILPPIQQLWATDCKLMKKAYKQMPRKTKIRRSHYSLISLIFLLSQVILISGIVLCVLAYDKDNSFELCPYCFDMPNGYRVPFYAPCAIILFTAISLIHYIFKRHRRHVDNKRLYAPLRSNPQKDFSDDMLD